MRTGLLPGAVALLLTAVPVQGAEAGVDSVASNYDVRELGDGVYALVRRDPPGLMCDANSVFIVNDEDVVVVDAPEASREMLETLRGITDKPVSALVNTHWHDDHLTGNALYREAFPDLEIVGHASMRDYLAGKGVENRRGMIEGAPGGVEMLRSQLAKGSNLAGEPIDAEERVSYESDIRLVEHYLEVVPQSRIVPPTLTVEDRLTLERGSRTIEILHLGAGHTAADLVVWLPRERIAVVGDLVGAPVPLVGVGQSHVLEWSGTLERLIELDPRTIVPGHGPVLAGVEPARRMAELFATISDRTRAAAAGGATLEEVREAVDLADQRRRFAGDSRLLGTLFDMYVAGPGVTAAFQAISP
ncbi:MAG: MBL fold metallo-hydrolase [Thermoanaerobaculia bacterium]